MARISVAVPSASDTRLAVRSSLVENGHTAGGCLTEIGRRRAVGEVPPALERPHRPRRHGDHLGLHHDPATSDAVLVAERLDADDLLTGRDFTPDHPVQRSARKDLFHSFRYHA